MKKENKGERDRMIIPSYHEKQRTLLKELKIGNLELFGVT